MVFQIVLAVFMILLTSVFVYHDSERLAQSTSLESSGTLTPSVFVSIIAAMISTSSVVVAFQQASTAKLNYVAASRPWIGIDEISFDSDLARGSDGNWTIKIKALLQNYGHSPATNVRFGAKIYFRHNPTGPEIFLPQEVSADRAFCKEMTTSPNRPFALGRTIFPGKVDLEGQNAVGEKVEEDEANRSFKNLPAEFMDFDLWIVGCVTYVGLDRHDTFNTPFLVEIGQHSPKNRAITVSLDGAHDFYAQSDLAGSMSAIADPPS